MNIGKSSRLKTLSFISFIWNSSSLILYILLSSGIDIFLNVEATAKIIPTRDGIKTNVIEEHSYNSNGEEIKEEYPPINYHISDDKVDTSFGAKSRFEDNVKAIELLKELESEDRNATKEEQDILSKYVGWGGIADAFDERKDNWKTERERLKLLLNEEEYKAAAHSTLSSFYTPNMAIDGIYKTLKQFGFEKGNILEPSCAIGNFFGRLPSEFDKSKLYGVELDSISGRIAKKLYPNAKIEITGYENSKVADELFDVAVGNVPFGSNTVYDKRYKDKFLIHDYFFQKTLDKVRDGGIIAFITTDGTLDKKDTRVREYIAKRAEFLGAIRLPNNTFTSNANAKVTSDIIFLKKRDELKQDISEEKWIYTSELEDGITINNYYIDNPNMMLGKMELQSTAYGYDNTLFPIDEDINILMNQAIEHLPSNIYEQTNYIQNEENDYDDYLRSLHMEAECKTFDDFLVPRVSQLMLRSNQFNLCTGRYTGDEIREFASKKENLGMAFSLEDRFGEVPQEVSNLMEIVRIRHAAEKLGFEKIIIKNGIMIAFFINNHISPYYRSKVFENILIRISLNEKTFEQIGRAHV